MSAAELGMKVVLTDEQVWGAPTDLAEVEARLARIPRKAGAFSLALLARRLYLSGLAEPQTQVEFAKVWFGSSIWSRLRDAASASGAEILFHYPAVMGAIRGVLALGTDDERIDLDPAEFQELGQCLLVLNRLALQPGWDVTSGTGDELERRRWLGLLQRQAMESVAIDVAMSCGPAALALRRVVMGWSRFGQFNDHFRIRAGFGVEQLFFSFNFLLGFVLENDSPRHLFKLSEITRGPSDLDRAAGPALRSAASSIEKWPRDVEGWRRSLSHGLTMGMLYRPLLIDGDTLACLDPRALAGLCGFRFGRVVEQAVEQESKKDRRLLGLWREAWRKVGFEGLAGELLDQCGTSERPRETDQSRCDRVVVNGRVALFAEAKCIFASPSSRALRDPDRLYAEIVRTYALKKDGLPQTLSTMAWAAADVRALASAAPRSAARWIPVVVTAEPVSMAPPWREEWAKLAAGLDLGPLTRPVDQPVFLSTADLAVLAYQVASGQNLETILGEWLRGSAASLRNHLIATVGHADSVWVRGKMVEYLGEVAEKIRAGEL